MTFLPDLPTLVAFSIACFVLTITPGPDMTLFLGRTLAGGRAAGIAAYVGASTGSLIHTTLAAIGLSALIAASPEAFLLLKIVGAGYLIFLAVQAIRSGSSLKVDATGEMKKPSLIASWLTGIGINLSNPKIILFFVTFLPQFVAAGDPDAAGKLFFLGVYFILFATPFALAMIVAADKLAATLKRRPKITRAIDWIFASVFSAFAVKILTTQGH
ncbi:MAG: LysE family translocator [Aurantimonas endophytica]|uniref:Threonine/homoserine/homoserine lactone efflux protein n=1 Tax=Aurantimonas endophytica TaxID=1522175 RepID=A0A7W6HEP6_9HYPH|nr:LysE family translocator [Aurantimonas endophytica]MBB4003761.1 threonine/homoserine/homoserine lactone efflux protein [Aurantimonas endophytica]MCO6404616.1 LysE family transporter [Aurantimonas endophytica]